MSSSLKFIYTRHRILAGVFGVRGLSTAGSIIFTFVVSRQLPLDGAGMVFLMTTYATGLALLCRYGMDVLLVKQLSATDKLQADKLAFLASTLTAFLVTTIATISAWFSAVYLLDLPHIPTITTAVLAVCMAMMFLCSSIMKAINHPIIGNALEGTVIYLLVSIAVIVLNADSAQYVLSVACVVAVITTLFSLIIVLWNRQLGLANFLKFNYLNKTTLFDISIVSSRMKQSTPYGLIAITSYVSQWGVVLITGILFNLEMVASISVLLRFLAPLHFIQLTIDSFLAPKFAGMRNPADIRALRRKGVVLALILGLPWVLLVILYSGELISFLAGSDYLPIQKSTVVLVIGYYIVMCLGCNGLIMIMRDMQIAALRLSVTRALIFCVSSVLFMYLFGITGVAMSYLLAIFVQVSLARYLVNRRFPAVS